MYHGFSFYALQCNTSHLLHHCNDRAAQPSWLVVGPRIFPASSLLLLPLSATAMALPRGTFPRSRTYSSNFDTRSSAPNSVSAIDLIEGPSPGLWTSNSPTFGIHVTGSPCSHAGHGSCRRPALRSMDFYRNVQLSRLYARYIMPSCVSSFHSLERA